MPVRTIPRSVRFSISLKRAFDGALHERMKALIDGIDADLDAPLLAEDE